MAEGFYSPADLIVFKKRNCPTPCWVRRVVFADIAHLLSGAQAEVGADGLDNTENT